MKAITEWFLDNPVAANLLMVFILVAGYLSFQSLRVESFPQIPPTRLVIEVTYPGGTAKQIDASITQRIEDAISGVAGIKSINSESSSGLATVRVEKNTGVELDRLIEDIRNQVESIVGLPQSAQRPRIYRDEYGNLAAFVIVYGGDNEDLLQTVSGRVQNALKRHTAISQVANLGKRRQELVIEPDHERLKKYGLNAQTLAEQINQWSLEYRSGTLKTARGQLILRGDGYADNLQKLHDLPVIVTDQAIIRLQDVAVVTRGFQPTDSIVRFQGESAIALMVSTSQKDNLLKVSEAIQEVLKAVETTLPQDIKTAVMADMAPYINEQLDLLGSNAWQGLLIVVVFLGIFLELKLAFWVAAGIPIALAGAVALMGFPAFVYSINDITLFGMILVLGILVDDAVVVGESIHEARKSNPDPKIAASKGVEAVATATIFGVLTTIAAFSPMLWIENELAKVLAGFSAVVIFALIFSLIESKFILPVHLSKESKKTSTARGLQGLLLKVRGICVGALSAFNRRAYQPALRVALRHKGSTLLLFLTLVLGAYAAMLHGNIRSVFFPEIPGRYATLKVTMDQDVALSLTQNHITHMEQSLQRTGELLQDQYGLTESPINQYLIAMANAKDLELTAELSKQALASIPSDYFLQTWQQQTGPIEGSYAVKYTLADEPAGGTAITVTAPSRDVARRVAQQLKQDLARLPGVLDVYDDSQSGQRQLQIKLNERGIQLGINQQQLAQLVGGAYGAIEVHRLIEGGEESLVIVRLPDAQKQTIEQLQATPLLLAKDHHVSLGEISDFVYSREPEVLYRRDRDEVVSVYWRQNRSISSPQKTWATIQQQALPALSQQFPNVEIKAIGEFAEIADVQAGFKKAMILTMLLIYVLLAIPLKSYWQPFIIMSVIPFGFAGAIYGHGLMDLSVSLLSLFGMMAMTGVVINDSLVLITRFNQLHQSGMAVNEALIAAGKSRLQAIFLTTMTTVCGLLPLLSETSEQAQYLKPAAVSLVFGELFATPITLILIPVLLKFGSYRSQPLATSQELKVVHSS